MRSSRIFTEGDQENFARWSGDRNPIHMDALAARRTAAGAPVVHGVHLLLWALEEALAAEPRIQSRCRLRADFRKFVFVGQPVVVESQIDPEGPLELRLFTSDGAVGSVRIRPEEGALEPIAISATPIEAVGPLAPTTDQMRDAAGTLPSVDGAEIGSAFPRLRDRISEQGVGALAQISFLVGMICPGLHSILAGIDVVIGAGGDGRIAFRTSRFDERFSLVRMEILGAGVGGSVEAFIRPAPVPSLTSEKAAELVSANVFIGRRALVVGGSRGLGAATAKLLAAGGADVTITYTTGAAEAAEICSEISRTVSGSCVAVALDVLKPVGDQLGCLACRPTHIYYFATPRIFLQKSLEFHREALDRFLDFYVNGFHRICAFFSARSAEPISILYPSSVAVTDRPAGLTEYAMAKLAGELLCEDIARTHPHLLIDVERLPRILTDQTATIQPVRSASAEEILLPLLMAERSR